MAITTNNSFANLPPDLRKKLEGEGYKIIVQNDPYYDPFTTYIYLFYEDEEIFKSENWQEVIDFQRKHIKLTKLIMPEDDDNE